MAEDKSKKTREDVAAGDATPRLSQNAPKPESDAGGRPVEPAPPGGRAAPKHPTGALTRTVIGYRIATFTVCLVFFLGLVLYGLYRLTHVLELFVVALLVAMAINPLVRHLNRKGVPRFLSVIVLLGVLAAVVVSLAAGIGPPLIDEITGFISNFGHFISQLQGYGTALETRFPGVDIDQIARTLQNQGQQQLNSILQSATAIFTASVTRLFETVLVVFLIVFMLMDPDPLVFGLRSLFPDKYQEDVQRIGLLAVGKVEAWIQGSLLLMLAIGFLTSVAMYWLGVPYALLWGVLAGILEIVPTVGPVLAAIPPTLVGLTESPMLAVKVVAAQFIIQQLESTLLVPVIMSNRVRLHPITLLFFLLAMAQLLGIFGALIATPVAAVVKVLYVELYYRRIHGNLPGEE